MSVSTLASALRSILDTAYVPATAGASARIDHAGNFLASTKETAEKALKSAELELRARSIIEAAREDEWSPTRQVILSVFSAQWTNALTVARIVRIGAALHDLTETNIDDAVARELSRLVRRGFLNSRMERGRRLYELDLSEKVPTRREQLIQLGRDVSEASRRALAD